MTHDSAAPYPVRLTGNLSAPPSRWMWLVKWILAIPHFLALIFLWIAFALLTIIAGFAVLFTGRYPRAIFDFNVGVLRWSWRVQFYAVGVLGTDKYPPFSLRRHPDYPADLDVEYPENLSRGLVLVKWWLLAIPHYLIVAAMTSGAVTLFKDADSTGGAAAASLLTVLTVIVAIALLFTARYPQGLFDFLLGIFRWLYRVAAYAALMRDEYPPFRLDQGGAER